MNAIYINFRKILKHTKITGNLTLSWIKEYWFWPGLQKQVRVQNVHLQCLCIHSQSEWRAVYIRWNWRAVPVRRSAWLTVSSITNSKCSRSLSVCLDRLGLLTAWCRMKSYSAFPWVWIIHRGLNTENSHAPTLGSQNTDFKHKTVLPSHLVHLHLLSVSKLRAQSQYRKHSLLGAL